MMKKNVGSNKNKCITSFMNQIIYSQISLTETNAMTEIRNPNGTLIAKQDPHTGTIEIKNKDWLTRIEPTSNGEPSVRHIKAT